MVVVCRRSADWFAIMDGFDMGVATWLPFLGKLMTKEE